MGDTLNVLAIGNSFSQDAFYYLQDLAVAGGQKLYNLNLYIGGCSLERHWCNLREGTKYDAQFMSKEAIGKLSIDEALALEDWDIVTLQQASGWSGMAHTVIDYVEKFYKYILTRLPNAKVWWHETWAYDSHSTHPHFEHYDCDQEAMFRGIRHTSVKVWGYGVSDLIPAGFAVQNLRKTPEFDYDNGGINVCRDGFHLNYVYGRLLVACVWYEKLFSLDCTLNPYIPSPLGVERVDEGLVALVKRVAHDTVDMLRGTPYMLERPTMAERCARENPYQEPHSR